MKLKILWIMNAMLVVDMVCFLAAAQTSDQLVITSPQDGAILPMQNQALIRAQFKPPVSLSMPTQVRVEATRGTEHIPIAEGDLRSLESPDQLHALWDISTVKPGPYLITVTALTGEHSGTATVNVRVHPIPRVFVRIEAFEKQGDGALVTFAAVAHSAAGTGIDEFIWTPGDGDGPTRTTTGTFSHFYPARGRTYVLWLRVDDVLGGSALIERDLILADVPNRRLTETHDCGCNNMTVRVANQNSQAPTISHTYCAHDENDILGIAGCDAINNPPEGACPKGEVPFHCQIGSILETDGSKRIGWSFEAIADLDPLTNDSDTEESKCKQGQYITVTRKVNGGAMNAGGSAQKSPRAGAITLGNFSFVAVGQPAPIPPFMLRPVVGPYGADDYAKKNSYKIHDPDVFRWFDALIFGPDPGQDTVSMTQDAEVITFVEGNLGTCWCDFTIREDWTKDVGFSGGVDLIQGQNCSLSPNQSGQQALLLLHDKVTTPSKGPGAARRELAAH